jgi:hypothetical protein
MNTSIISEDNLEKYRDYLDPEEAENIGREYYCGMALEDDDGGFLAGMIWELLDFDNEDADSSANLKWIHSEIDPAGKYLFEEYGDYVRNAEVGESRFEFSDEECKAQKQLLESEGFNTGEKEGRTLIVTVGDLMNLKVLRIDKKIPSYIMPISSLSERDFQRGIMNCIFHSRRPLIEDLNSLPMDWYDEELSCYATADGRVNGFLLVHRTILGKLRVELFIDVGPDSQKDLLHMARYTIKRAIDLYDETTEVVLVRRDESATRLVEFLFPGKKGLDVLAGYRREQ